MRELTHFDPTSTAASYAVVRTLAERVNTTPAELEPPLYESIDPEALDRLIGDGNGSTAVTFRHLGREITVSSDGVLQVVEDSTHTSEHTL